MDIKHLSRKKEEYQIDYYSFKEMLFSEKAFGTFKEATEFADKTESENTDIVYYIITPASTIKSIFK